MPCIRVVQYDEATPAARAALSPRRTSTITTRRRSAFWS